MDELLLIASESASWGSLFTSTIDVGYKFSMVIIAIVNALLLFQRNKKSDKDAAEVKEKDRRISLLKTLILDYNLHYFYEVFDEIEKELVKLEEKSCNKEEIEKALQKLFKKMFEKFINFISVIDDNLYGSLKEACDHCRDTLVGNIADEGVNLYVPEKYKEYIESVVETDKKKMISLLFEFKG